MKNFVLLAALLAATMGLTACNTIKGMGQDISSGAETVQGWF